MKNRAKKQGRISLRLEETTRDKLFAVADAKERTASWLVEKCIKIALPELEKQLRSFNPAQGQHLSLAA